MATWTTPKTNWVATDYFNIGDYNRIVGNLLYLRDCVPYLFATQPTYTPMEENKVYSSMLYAREFNAIENNLKALNDGTYGFDIGTTKTYQANQKMPNYEEYNRIESAILKLKIQLTADIGALHVLPFRLGDDSIAEDL